MQWFWREKTVVFRVIFGYARPKSSDNGWIAHLKKWDIKYGSRIFMPFLCRRGNNSDVEIKKFLLQFYDLWEQSNISQKWKLSWKILGNKVCWISCVHSIKEVLMLIEGCACMLTHLTLCDPRTVACQPACPWNSPGKNTGVGCHLLLQGMFLMQGLNSWISGRFFIAKPPGKPEGCDWGGRKELSEDVTVWGKLRLE